MVPQNLILLTSNIGHGVRECAIDIVIDGPPIQTNWYDLWASAVAIVAMCVTKGKDGVAAVKGKFFE